MNKFNLTLAPNIIPAAVRFWTYLTADILSVNCTLFVLYYLLFDRTLRHALHNHVIIVLLIIGLINELTSIPWNLYRYQFGVPLIKSRIFYLSTFFFDYEFYTTQVILFAWATIERHILVFHDQWLSTRKKRFFFHYLPIISILIYCLVYYSVITFGPFCKNTFISFLSGGFIIPCVYSNKVLATWDLLVHQLLSTLIIVIFSIALIVRVVKQNRKMNRPILWQKHRKMIIQLLSISVVYLTFNSPWILILFASQYGLPANVARVYTFYGLYVRTYVVFLFPFACFASSSELQDKFRKRFLCCYPQ
jgi:hypothetical protein